MKLSTISLVLAASTLAACSASSSSSTNDPKTDIAVVKSAAERNTTPTLPPNELDAFERDQAAFAVDLYHSVRKDPSLDGKDVFLSPHSVSIALAMTYAGARGETKAEMKKALHFGLDDDRLHNAFNWLDLALASRGAQAKAKDGQPFRLNVVNSIWGQKGAAFEAPFLDTLAVNYGAGLETVDFAKADGSAEKAINAWVEDKTEKRIKDLVSGLDPMTKLVLVNAVYFNAAWQSKFEKTATAPAAFTKLDGSTVDVPMMHGGGEMPYAAGDGYEAVQMAYDGGDTSMLVIAPTKGSFATFESSLTGDKMLEIMAGMKRREVILGFPKAHVEASFELTKPLQALGMKSAFEGGADFSGILKDNLSISAVLHKTFLDLDEDGTEAAAATAVVVGGTSAPVDPPVKLTVDRPYIVAIVDNATRTLVFLGRITQPKAG